MPVTRGTKTVAAPQLPAAPQPVDVDTEPFGDDTRWWQGVIDGGDFTAAGADGFEIEQCRLRRADFTGGDWEHGTWRDCDLSDGSLANVTARRTLAQRVRWTRLRATGLQWTDGVVKDVTVTGCRLDLAGFRFSKLRSVVFDDCRLTGADFTGADLTGTVWRGCDLTGAKFHQATMTGARVDDCVLDGVNGIESWRGATVSGPDLLALTYSLAAACGITVEHPGAG